MTGSPVDVGEEVSRGFEQAGKKGVRFPLLDGAVAMQRRPGLEVVVHPPPVFTEPIAVGHVRHDIVPTHTAAGKGGSAASGHGDTTARSSLSILDNDSQFGKQDQTRSVREVPALPLEQVLRRT